jgi:4-hydroxy-3-polyprenylbenzoate decarboxylase
LAPHLIVGISGASGAVYGIKLLETLRKNHNVKTHLVVTKAAWTTIKLETGLSKDDVKKLASFYHKIDDLSAVISSGSFKTQGMAVVPCSMKTLAGIAHGYADNLLLRAADVTLKERRPLVLVPRETPLNIIHLENMLKAAHAGAVILPPAPGFYHKPKTVTDMVNYVVGRILDCFQIEHGLYRRWEGVKPGKPLKSPRLS